MSSRNMTYWLYIHTGSKQKKQRQQSFNVEFGVPQFIGRFTFGCWSNGCGHKSEPIINNGPLEPCEHLSLGADNWHLLIESVTDLSHLLFHYFNLLSQLIFFFWCTRYTHKLSPVGYYYYYSFSTTVRK